MTKDDFLGLLYDACLPEGAIPEVLEKVEPVEDRTECLREALRVIKSGAEARGAWDAIKSMPPFVSSQHAQGDVDRFMDTLFPFGRGSGALAATSPPHVDFWEWQKQLTPSLERRHPVRDEARRKWLGRCRADRRWSDAIEEIAESYTSFVRFVDAVGSYERSNDFLAPWFRGPSARSGLPDCFHVATTPGCDGCEQEDVEAHEAHWGWTVTRDWAPIRGLVRRQPAPCGCCASGHDRRPRGSAACRLCAEAIFWMNSEHAVRRWGGWPWLLDELRADAMRTSRDSDSGLLDRELELGLVWQANEYHLAALDRIERFGTDPWHGDSWLDGGRLPSVGTVYLPVRVLSTDLKHDVQERAINILNEVWSRLDPKRAEDPR